MKRIEKILLDSCALSVLITSVFFIFAKISSPDITPAVHIGKYFLIILFSFIIVCANLLFSIKKLHKVLAVLIHYLVSLVAFLLIFVTLSGLRPMQFIVFVVLFTIFYAALFAAIFGIKRGIKKLDVKFERKSETESKKSEYKPRYK